MSLPVDVASGTGSGRSIQREPPVVAHQETSGRMPTATRSIGLARQIQLKIHGLALGMTLGLGTMFLGQGCVAAGQ